MTLSMEDRQMIKEARDASLRSATLLEEMVKPRLERCEKKLARHSFLLTSWNAVLCAILGVAWFLQDKIVSGVSIVIGRQS